MELPLANRYVIKGFPLERFNFSYTWRLYTWKGRMLVVKIPLLHTWQMEHILKPTRLLTGDLSCCIMCQLLLHLLYIAEWSTKRPARFSLSQCVSVVWTAPTQWTPRRCGWQKHCKYPKEKINQNPAHYCHCTALGPTKSTSDGYESSIQPKAMARDNWKLGALHTRRRLKGLRRM